MSTPSSLNSVRTRIETVVALAGLLQRVETGPARIDAGQYRLLVEHLKAALAEELPGDALDKILAAFPAAADVYENLHYAHAGLSRASLERSVSSEMLAAKVIAQASGRPAPTAR